MKGKTNHRIPRRRISKGATTYNREFHATELQSVSASGRGWKGDPEISPWKAQCNSTLTWYVVPQSIYCKHLFCVYWGGGTTESIHSCHSESFGLEIPAGYHLKGFVYAEEMWMFLISIGLCRKIKFSWGHNVIYQKVGWEGNLERYRLAFTLPSKLCEPGQIT